MVSTLKMIQFLSMVVASLSVVSSTWSDAEYKKPSSSVHFAEGNENGIKFLARGKETDADETSLISATSRAGEWLYCSTLIL